MSQNQFYSLDWAESAFAQAQAGAVTVPEGALRTLRQEALDVVKQTGIPTPKVEDWKYTNVSALSSTAWKPFRSEEVISTGWTIPSEVLFAERSALLVFRNGQYIAELSDPGFVQVGSVTQATPEFATRFGSLAQAKENPFVALNTAFFTQPVYIRATQSEPKPIQILHLTDRAAENRMSSPRLFIEVDKNVACSVVETYAALGAEGQGSYFTNSVVEVVLGENSSCEHTKIQTESETAYHIGSLWMRQANSSRFTSNVFHFGGRMVRNEIYPVIDGSGAECYLNGLTAVNGEQHVDNFTVIDHAQPNSFSREIYKGIYDDHAHGVFSGTIIVRPDAQKTNAIQSNQTVLLSDTASIESRPQLKIWADDVKCTHGATVGQLDAHGLFYLRSRGISEEQAKHLLLHAFASEVIYHLEKSDSRDTLEALLLGKLGGGALE